MPVSRAQLEQKLNLNIVTVCLATVSKEKDSLRQAKDMLMDAIEKIVREAERGS